jgi:CelD/BcsL family acetyltransferase involved in cellulose biosynthesis
MLSMMAMAGQSAYGSCETIERLEEMEAIEPEWRSLWSDDPSATPFQSPDWLIPWTRCLWGGGLLRVLAVRSGGRLIAVAPFFIWGRDDRNEPRTLSFLGSGISDYLGPACRAEYASLAADIVARWIAVSAEWQVCDLQELRADSPLAVAVARELRTAAQPCSLCPVLRLPGAYSELLMSLPVPFRRSLRTAEKRLETAGAVEIVPADARNWPEILDRLFALHTARWRARGEDGMLATGALKRFHYETAERFQRLGALRLYELRVNDVPVAVQYNFAAKGREYAYLAGFDEAWQRSSPGAALLARCIERAIEEGAGEFDFLRKSEEFKYAWGARDSTNMRILACRDR